MAISGNTKQVSLIYFVVPLSVGIDVVVVEMDGCTSYICLSKCRHATGPLFVEDATALVDDGGEGPYEGDSRTEREKIY